MDLNARIPDGPIESKWENHVNHIRLVGPRNRPHYRVIVVGTGLAGASAASSMAAMGYKVDAFCFQDSPRRAHSIAAQGGINAALQNNIYDVFVLTLKQLFCYYLVVAQDVSTPSVVMCVTAHAARHPIGYCIAIGHSGEQHS